jgi:hypothetical protein
MSSNILEFKVKIVKSQILRVHLLILSINIDNVNFELQKVRAFISKNMNIFRINCLVSSGITIMSLFDNY